MNSSHMSALRIKHAELEEQLDREENRPLPDTNLVHSLKKQKLMLKDVMTHEAQPATSEPIALGYRPNMPCLLSADNGKRDPFGT